MECHWTSTNCLLKIYSYHRLFNRRSFRLFCGFVFRLSWQPSQRFCITKCGGHELTWFFSRRRFRFCFAVPVKAFSYLVIYLLLHLASPTYTRSTWGKMIRSSGHADSTVLEYRKRNQGPSILRPLRQLNCNPFEEEWKMWLNGWFNQKRCRIN